MGEVKSATRIAQVLLRLAVCIGSLVITGSVVRVAAEEPAYVPGNPNLNCKIKAVETWLVPGGRILSVMAMHDPEAFRRVVIYYSVNGDTDYLVYRCDLASDQPGGVKVNIAPY